MSKHRVVVTGLGLVTPVGVGHEQVWQQLAAGVSGISTYEGLVEGPYAPAVGSIQSLEYDLDRLLERKEQSRLDIFTQYALVAAAQAMQQAGLDRQTAFARERCGVYLGVGIGGLGTIQHASLAFDQRGVKGISPLVLPKAINNSAPSWLSMFFNVQGPSTAITNACSSGADAIGLAFRALRHGYADVMLAGGTEACAIPLTMAAFGNMRALSRWQGDTAAASRPFSADRTGFVLAQGAGVLVLERYEHAVQRGATILGEVVGYGATEDAHHLTAMHPEGRGAAAAMEQALADAGISPEQVGYLNAHGTGTPMNDLIETMAIKQVFGSCAQPDVPQHLLVSSTKSMTGHMLGAAGAVEAGVCLMSLQNQFVPPTINLTGPDPACDLDYVACIGRAHAFDYALSNSFGFGGANAVLAFKKV